MKRASSLKLSARLSEVSGHPGGEWDNREPSFGRTVKQLLKKQWLIKVRHIASIIEFVAALLVYIIIYPTWYLAQYHYDEVLDPEYFDTDNQSYPMSELLPFFAIGEQTKLYFYPKSDSAEFQMIKQAIVTTFQTIIDYIPLLNISMGQPKLVVKDFDNLNDLKNDLTETDEGGVAITFPDMLKDDLWYTHPKIDLYVQSLSGSPSKYLIKVLREYLALATASHYLTPETFDQDKAYRALAIKNTKIIYQEFSKPNTTYLVAVQVVIAFFAIMPIILAIMPDFQAILDEKDTKVAPFSFLMGCSETAYWLVNFLNAFILCIIPYFIMSCMLCFGFGLTGTSFSLFFVVCILFVISHIWFQFWLATMMKYGSNGKSLTVIMLVISLFFCFLHNMFTLSKSNSSTAVKHVFSIIPVSCYAMVIEEMWYLMVNGFDQATWSNVMADLDYNIWWGLMWLAIDAVLYFLLFLLFNATMPRAFGTPLIRWNELFSAAAWRRLFHKESPEQVEALQASEKALVLENLHKVYHNGHKDIEALKGIDCEIKTGEVIVVMGPNGAGKSTLVNIIAGAIEPSDGEMSLYGSQMSKRFKDVQKYLGVVFQENVIINLLSVREHLILFGAFRGIPQDELETAIEFFAETLQLTHMLDNRAGDLSGGQKRKLCIAMSLLGNPPIVIMDEPTAGVDVQARQLIWRTIAELEDTTTIVTSHALEEAETVSSRLFIVSGGHVAFMGTSTEMRNHFKCGYVLRVELKEGFSMEPLLELTNKHLPESKQSEERDDQIRIPVSDAVPAYLNDLESKKEELGVVNYTFSVEQIEDTLLKICEDEEAPQ